VVATGPRTRARLHGVALEHIIIQYRTIAGWNRGKGAYCTLAATCMIQEVPLKKYLRGIFFLLNIKKIERAQANSANQPCHFKSSRCCIELLGTYSCRRTVPMAHPVSNSSMHHWEPIKVYKNLDCVLSPRQNLPRDTCTLRNYFLAQIVENRVARLCRLLGPRDFFVGNIMTETKPDVAHIYFGIVDGG
jgi:hypothetical protein